MKTTKMKSIYISLGGFILAILFANIGYASTSVTFNSNFTAFFNTATTVNITSTNSLEATVTHRSTSGTRTVNIIPQRRNAGGTWANAGGGHLFASTASQQTFVRTWTRTQLAGAGTYRLSFNANAGSGTIHVGGSFRPR